MKLSLAHKRAIREAIRAEGLDPMAMSPTEFMQWAKEHDMLDADKLPKRQDKAPAKTKAKAKAPKNEHVEAEPMTAHDDVKDDRTGPAYMPQPNPSDYDLTDPTGAAQYAADVKEAKDHNDAIDAANEAMKPMQDALDQMQKELDAANARADQAAEDAEVKTLKLERPDDPEPVVINQPHSLLESVLKMLNAGLNVYMNGPAGSGKTTLATQAATALKATFYFTGKLAEEYQLLGYNDANGNYVPTEFYKACTSTEPAVFLFDEFDDSDSKAVTKFNAALANRFMDFPCGRVEIPDHVHFIAAGNTTGKGGNRTYLRNQLDGATMDRFVFLTVDYDLKLERRLALARNPEAGAWVDWVQETRKRADKAGLNMVISPRASIHGAVMLAAGFSLEDCKEMTVYKGASEDQIAALS